MSSIIDAEWLRLNPIRVGRVPLSLGTPDCYVTVTDNDGMPVLRVDIYACGPDCFAFEDAIIWQNNIIIGFGSYVYAVSITTHAVVIIPLSRYYCGFYPTSDYLLIASGERLLRMEPDRSIMWESELLAIDGVVVQEPGPPLIRGEGEWDPPGGWKQFLIFAANGKVVS